jgi:divalent metal cation (Fe/Co/Zn/Cd) transporter
MPVLDGVASIVIGVILAIIATLLAYESKGLLIGEAASPQVVAGVREILDGDRRIKQLNELLTMHLGPADVLLNVSVDFADALSSNEVEQAISAFEHSIKSRFPEITRVFIEAQSWRGHQRGVDEQDARQADDAAC